MSCQWCSFLRLNFAHCPCALHLLDCIHGPFNFVHDDIEQSLLHLALLRKRKFVEEFSSTLLFLLENYTE